MIMNMVMTTMIMNKVTTLMNKVTTTRVVPYYYCKHKHDAEDDMNDMVAIVASDTNTMKMITIITKDLDDDNDNKDMNKRRSCKV
jgi:hypothetical protein